jgi:hypothetical protein
LANTDPLSHFGQRIASSNETGITVPMYNVDSLRKEFVFDHLHVIHMDVQGTEADVVRGCEKTIKEGDIDYLLIATHNNIVEKEIKQILSPTHSLVGEVPFATKTGTHIESPGFSRVVIGKGDGVQIWQRRTLL